MPNTQERTDRRLEEMTDEQLRQILREDASRSEGEDTDMELMLQVMEVLATRRKEHGEGKSPAEALDSFNQNYCTTNEYQLISEKVREPKITSKAFVWKRIAAMAAVLALVIVVSTVSASAWDFDLWDIICQWTKETFHFSCFGDESDPNVPTPERENPCASLQEALDKYMISLKLVPTWLPDGYEEVLVDILENPKQRNFFATYQCGDQEIFIQITDYLGKDPSQAEQSGTPLEIYSANKIAYYIFENNNTLQIFWINDSFECYISCSLTLDEIKLIIDSIEKG